MISLTSHNFGLVLQQIHFSRSPQTKKQIHVFELVLNVLKLSIRTVHVSLFLQDSHASDCNNEIGITSSGRTLLLEQTVCSLCLPN